MGSDIYANTADRYTSAVRPINPHKTAQQRLLYKCIDFMVGLIYFSKI
jgi:hypothetical protein